MADTFCFAAFLKVDIYDGDAPSLNIPDSNSHCEFRRSRIRRVRLAIYGVIRAAGGQMDVDDSASMVRGL